MMFYKRLFQLILIVWFCLSTSWAKPPTGQSTIIVSSEEWQGYTHSDGSGYFFELIKTIYEPLGYRIKFELCPWKRCIHNVAGGKTDLTIGLYQDETNAGSRLKLPRYPINLEKVFVAFKASTPWQNKFSIKYQPVVQLGGYDYHLNIGLPVKLTEAKNTNHAWRMLMGDKARFYLSDIRQIEWAMDYYNTPQEEIRIEPVFQKWAYLAYSDNLKGQKLIDEFERRYPALFESGEIQALQQKYQLPWPVPLHDSKQLLKKVTN